jgi:hypothetical protein
VVIVMPDFTADAVAHVLCRLGLPGLLYGHTRAGVRERNTGSELRGRYWDRTSDLLGVNEALSR